MIMNKVVKKAIKTEDVGEVLNAKKRWEHLNSLIAPQEDSDQEADDPVMVSIRARKA